MKLNLNFFLIFPFSGILLSCSADEATLKIKHVNVETLLTAVQLIMSDETWIFLHPVDVIVAKQTINIVQDGFLNVQASTDD